MNLCERMITTNIIHRCVSISIYMSIKYTLYLLSNRLSSNFFRCQNKQRQSRINREWTIQTTQETLGKRHRTQRYTKQLNFIIQYVHFMYFDFKCNRKYKCHHINLQHSRPFNRRNEPNIS